MGENLVPTRVELVQENYKFLANCVAGKIDASNLGRGVRIRIDEGHKRALVFEPFGFVQNTRAFDFRFFQMEEKQTKIESYGFATLVGRDHYPNQIWPFVFECAGLEDVKS